MDEEKDILKSAGISVEEELASVLRSSIVAEIKAEIGAEIQSLSIEKKLELLKKLTEKSEEKEETDKDGEEPEMIEGKEPQPEVKSLMAKLMEKLNG